ncbi:chaplin [Streptomyces reniochalinae]|uniref:DUF320 domain-containing protein n=1 Tax=Streptomyces reniochalinae TaxID=2250578 RepID=A0A367E655_9ACTN|nr:chaplin [Streptomyces reniochalinae]RCG13463.1 DUF320 domain-containing protein [Streptomyces reniochalinae]
MRQGTRKGLITMAAAGGLFAMSGGTAFADAGAQGDSANSPGVLSGNTFQAPVNVTVNICGNTVSVIGLLNPASGNGCAGLGSGSGGPGGDSGAHEGQPSGQSPQGGRGDQVTGGGSGGNGSHAGGSSQGSPGVGSGNDVQVPVDVPVDVCGNTVDVGGILDPAHGNGCAAPEAPGPVDPGYPEQPEEPGKPGEPEKPHHPENPGHPGNPGEPEQPGQPDEPGGPDRPQNPDEPTPPNSPQTPDQPGSTGEVHAASQPVPAAETPGTADADAHGELAHTGAGSQLGAAAPLSMGLLAGGYVLYRRSRAAARR